MVTLEVMEDEKTKDVLRVCKTCGAEKDLSEFGVNRRYADGVQRDCKSCVKAKSGDRSSYLKGWRAQNLERARKGSSQSYQVRVSARKRYYEEHGGEPLSREAHEEACRKYIIKFRAEEKGRKRVQEDEARLNELAALGSKTCKGCGESKALSEFSADSTTRGGMQGCCKSCVKAYNQSYYRENREKLLVQTREWAVSHKEAVSAYHKEWQCKNAAHVKEAHARNYRENLEARKAVRNRYREEYRGVLLHKSKIYRESHVEYYRAYLRGYLQKNRAVIREYKRSYDFEKRREDVGYKLKALLRVRLYHALKGNAKMGSAVRDLGCTIPELKAHLEQQFQPGMSWDNWGNGPGDWSIDHIKCLAGFDLRDPEHLKEACNFRNLRPLWHVENISRTRLRRSKTPKAEAA